MSKGTIVFIHGMYMNALCWEHWVPWFEKSGYRCLAPSWPDRQASPTVKTADLTLTKILDHMDGIIRKTGEKPILIGHSMGALAAQLLLQRGIAAAAVAIDSAPPAGVLTPSLAFLRSNWPHITPFKRQDLPIEMTPDRFRYTFVHTMSPEAQRKAFDRYVVPESRRVPRESLTRAARVNFKAPHAPLLLIAGTEDHIVPASLNKTNFRRYKDPGSVVSFKEFPGRTHFIIGQEGWEEVARYVAGWLTDQGK